MHGFHAIIHLYLTFKSKGRLSETICNHVYRHSHTFPQMYTSASRTIWDESVWSVRRACYTNANEAPLSSVWTAHAENGNRLLRITTAGQQQGSNPGRPPSRQIPPKTKNSLRTLNLWLQRSCGQLVHSTVRSNYFRTDLSSTLLYWLERDFGELCRAEIIYNKAPPFWRIISNPWNGPARSPL